MTARDELRREMVHYHLYMTDDRADELIDACIVEALTDRAQHENVARLLRVEARRDPEWLAAFLRRQARVEGRRRV